MSATEYNIMQLAALRIVQEEASRPVLERSVPKRDRKSTGSTTSDYHSLFGSSPSPTNPTEYSNFSYGSGSSVVDYDASSRPPTSVSMEPEESAYHAPDSLKSFGHDYSRFGYYFATPATRALNPCAPTFVPESEKSDGPEELENRRNNFPDPRRLKIFVQESAELTGDIRKLETEIKDILEKEHPKRVPHRGSGYVCHVCYKVEDHFITDCPMKFNGSHMTSYQGSKKCVGIFQCTKCKRKWMSKNSYANMSMQCHKCKIPAFPHKQFSLRRAMEQGKVPESCVQDSKVGGSSSNAGQFVVGHRSSQYY